jgi:hypothetical protein
LPNGECLTSHASPNITKANKSRRIRQLGLVARMANDRNVYNVLMVNPEGKSPLETPKSRCDDNMM